MPARIVFVHDDPSFRSAVFNAFANADLSFAWYPDPLEASDALEAARSVELIITRLHFPDGRSNGVSLIQLARQRNRAVRAIFTETPGMESYVHDLGRYIDMPVALNDLMTAVSEELCEYDRQRRMLTGQSTGRGNGQSRTTS
jgi:DNA-binding NtrC family response regulator